jgi:hypothetical protein
MKAMAVSMYARGNMSFRGIGRLLGVSHVNVMRWIKAYTQILPEPSPRDDQVVIMADEMCHFIKRDLQTLALESV